MKRESRKSERGIALIAVGIAIFAFFALIVIAVDVGRFSHTASEIQAVADLAALSGAKNVQSQGAGTAQAGADTAALQNKFDGRVFVNNGSVATLNAEEGCFTKPDPACSSDCSGIFTAGGIASCPSPQLPAVRATATGKGVQVVTAALLGSGSQHDLTRRATAVVAGPNGVQPSLPVTLCPALLAILQPNQECVQGATLDTVVFAPTGTGNACYSNLGLPGGAGASDFKSLLPPECGGIATGDRPVVSIDQSIQTQNGVDNSFLHALQACVAGGVHDFVLPVVDCGDCTQSHTVIDFVTLHIELPSQVVDSGPAAGKGIHNATQICDNHSSGGGGGLGGGNFGKKSVVLVQ